jgi:hypothetical protein
LPEIGDIPDGSVEISVPDPGRQSLQEGRWCSSAASRSAARTWVEPLRSTRSPQEQPQRRAIRRGPGIARRKSMQGRVNRDGGRRCGVTCPRTASPAA